MAAKALVRMGHCYEKLGDAESRKAYERVVREFADQKETVAAARTRLAALGGGAQSAGGMSLRRVDSGRRFKHATGVSSDGRLIAFSYSDDGGSQGLYDTTTRQEKILVKLDWNGLDYGGVPAISRDGKWMAFGTYRFGATDAELRVVRADGSEMRTIHKLAGKSWISSKDWTPDNQQVLAQISHEGTTYLCLVNAADGAVKRLKQVSSDDRQAWISPDGASVVYVALDWKIRVMALDGSGDEAPLLDEPQARPMGWSPDGKGVLVLSRKTGEPGLWLVPVTNGKASGEPRLLRAGMSATTWPAGLTSDGRLYFAEEDRTSNSYLVQLDAASGAAGKPARVTLRFEGRNGYAAWSPDGRKLAWFGLKQSDTYGGALLHIRDLASGRERTLGFADSAFGSVTPQWLADNRMIVYSRMGDEPMLPTLFRFDTETGESSPLAANVNAFHTVTSDGGVVYHVRATDYGKILALDTRTKAEREVFSVDGKIFHLAVSPDGGSLACRIIPKIPPITQRLVIIDTQTGKSHNLVEQLAGGIPFFRRSLGWTPDGSSVVVRADDGVWAYPVAGGDRKLLLQADGKVSDVALSPDGKTMAFTQSADQTELWVLENFLPKGGK